MQRRTRLVSARFAVKVVGDNRDRVAVLGESQSSREPHDAATEDNDPHDGGSNRRMIISRQSSIAIDFFPPSRSNNIGPRTGRRARERSESSSVPWGSLLGSGHFPSAAKPQR